MLSDIFFLLTENMELSNFQIYIETLDTGIPEHEASLKEKYIYKSIKKRKEKKHNL